MANKKYKLTDGNMWATDGIHDFGQNKTQRTINSEVNSALGGKAPTNHASTATTYGAASTSNYGHVKLSNTTPSMDGTAAVGDSTDVARANHVHPSDTSRVPTSRKVNNKQLSSDITLSAADVSAVPTSRKVNDKQLSADITLSASDVGAAPTSHASTATTYGKGTSSNYGHVKISDSLTDTTTAATGGVVPSMKAVSDLNGAITFIRQRKRKIIFLGDSFGLTTDNWVDFCAAYMDLTSSDYINKCKSGGGFIFDPDVGEGGNAFLNQLITVTADRDTYTDIVCCGGINDARGSEYMSSIYPNIRAFISYAHTNFPNAEIHIGFIGSALNNSSVIGVKKYGNRMLALQEYIKAASPYYMSGVENAIHTSEANYDTDRFHPNATGARYIGLSVANAVTNNYCDVRNKFIISLTRSNTTISTNSIEVDITGDYAIITIPESFFAQFSSAQNIGRTNDKRIEFTISGDLFFDQQVSVESFVQITRNGTGEILPCIWWFNGKTIGVNIESLANGSWETIPTNYVYVNAPIDLVVPIQKIN